MIRPLAMVLAAATTFFLTAANHIPELYPPYGVVLQSTFNSGDAYDSSQYHVSPTLANGAAVTAGNRYLTLDGTNDCAAWSDANDPVITGAFSASMWFQPSTPGSQPRMFLSKWLSAGNQRAYTLYCRYDTSPTVYFFAWTEDGSSVHSYSFNAAVPTSGWHHICMVFDPSAGNGNRAKLYIDGAAVSASSITSDSAVGIFNSTSELLLGAQQSSASPGSAWKGDIDDARLYSRVISAAEVQQLYSAGRP